MAWISFPGAERTGWKRRFRIAAASAFAEVLGRAVTPTLVPPERRAALFAHEGVPAEVASALLGMYDGIANGRFVRQGNSEHRRGTTSLIAAIEHRRKGLNRSSVIFRRETVAVNLKLVPLQASGDLRRTSTLGRSGVV